MGTRSGPPCTAPLLPVARNRFTSPNQRLNVPPPPLVATKGTRPWGFGLPSSVQVCPSLSDSYNLLFPILPATVVLLATTTNTTYGSSGEMAREPCPVPPGGTLGTDQVRPPSIERW